MLAPALWRHRGDRAFHDLQQRLLDALARHVAGDRGVVRLARNLVDLVDIDDAALGALNIVVGGLKQLQNNVLDILADIARFRQRRRIRHREGHIENACQRLREQRLAAAGRADQQNVRLRQLDITVLAGVIEALVVIVNRNGEHFLCVLLADDIVVEHAADFLRRRHAVARLHERGLVLLADDVHAQLDALVTDEDCGARDQLTHFMLAFAAE